MGSLVIQGFEVNGTLTTVNMFVPIDLLKPILGIEDPRTSDRITFVGGIRGAKALKKTSVATKKASRASVAERTFIAGPGRSGRMARSLG